MSSIFASDMSSLFGALRIAHIRLRRPALCSAEVDLQIDDEEDAVALERTDQFDLEESAAAISDGKVSNITKDSNRNYKKYSRGCLLFDLRVVKKNRALEKPSA
jgi:hypothetical protein